VAVCVMNIVYLLLFDRKRVCVCLYAGELYIEKPLFTFLPPSNSQKQDIAFALSVSLVVVPY